MNAIKKLLRNRATIERMLHQVDKDLKEAHSRRILRCGHCETRHRLGKLTLLDVHWYDECTGSPCGGMWLHYYHAWKCPACGQYRNNKMKLYCSEDKLWSGSFAEEEKVYPKGG